MSKFLIAMPECLPEETQKHLIAAAKKYDKYNGFNDFKVEIGYEDWMDDYYDDDDPTETEIKTIDEVLQYYYDKAHQDDE